MGIPGWKSKVCLDKQVILSLADIQRVYVTVDSINPPPFYVVHADLDSNGAKGLTGFMRANVGKCMGIVVNGSLLTAPMIKAAPRGWHTELALKFFTETEKDEAYKLVDAITQAMKG
jgi:preprotein translocase subunit SecD